MKRLVDVHVRHDLVGEFDAVVGAGFGRNLGKAERSLRIDESRIYGHAGDVDDSGVLRKFDGGRCAERVDLAALHDEDTVIDYAMRDREHLPAFEDDGLLLGSGKNSRAQNDGNEERAMGELAGDNGEPSFGG